MNLQAKSGQKRARLGALIGALVMVAAACEPGWMNPLVGTGDGSGTTPGTEVVSAEASLQTPTAVAVRPGGGFYVYDSTACAIYQESGAGATSVYAGTPGSCGTSGDGGAAAEAQIDGGDGVAGFSGNSLAVGPDGVLYLAVPMATELRIVTTDGNIHSTAPVPDGFVVGVTVAPDGNVYVGTGSLDNQSEILRLEADGSWTSVYRSSVAGIVGLVGVSANELAFAELTFESDPIPYQRLDLTTGDVTPTGVELVAPWGQIATAVESGGAIYIGANSHQSSSIVTDSGTFTDQVVRLDPNGEVTAIAGTGNPDPSINRQVGYSFGVDLSPAGLVATRHNGLLVSSGHVVYRLDQPTRIAPPSSTTTIPSTTVPPSTTTPPSTTVPNT